MLRMAYGERHTARNGGCPVQSRLSLVAGTHVHFLKATSKSVGRGNPMFCGFAGWRVDSQGLRRANPKT